MTLLVVFILITVCFSFLCSLLEAVLLSVSAPYVAVKKKEGSRAGVLLDRHRREIDRPLAAILTLNTFANTLGAAGVGAQVLKIFGSNAVAVASFLLTLAILYGSEIIPKTLGATHWKKLAGFAAYAIQLLITILYPFVLVAEVVAGILNKPRTQGVTREEMIMTAEIGATDGTLERKESLIIKNLLMLDQFFVSDIMTPRSVFFAIEHDLTVAEVAEKYKPIRFSRIPVYQDNIDNIQGMTHRYKILEALSNDEHDTPIKDLMVPLSTVPEQMTVAAVLDLFIRRKEHIFLAVDEYGVVTGLVSLEDAVETLLGVEIVDEFDSVADMRQFALEQWQIRKRQIRQVK